MTKIIGHRGFSSKAPENSLSAIELAIQMKCDYFEIDVQSSKDLIPYVLHDDTLDRTSSNFTGNISDYTANQLEDCLIGFPHKFGSQFYREPLPKLETALVLAKGRIKVCIELKNPDLAEAVYLLLVKLGMLNSVVIFSFYDDCLAELKRLDSTLKLLYLTEGISAEDFNKAKELEAIGIGINVENDITPALINTFKAQELECWVWTVNDLKKMEACFKQGVHGIITDYPDQAKVFSFE